MDNSLNHNVFISLLMTNCVYSNGVTVSIQCVLVIIELDVGIVSNDRFKNKIL